MLKVLGILFLLAAVAYAAVARYPPEPKPEEYADQEGCYLISLDKVLPYDTPYNSGEAPCGQYVCQKSTNETLFETCGVIAVRDGCKKSPEDLTKNYPECCSKEVCDPAEPSTLQNRVQSLEPLFKRLTSLTRDSPQ